MATHPEKSANNNQTRPVFIISDRTGITAGTISHTLLTQFPDVTFDKTTIPFVDSDDKVNSTIRQIDNSHKQTGMKPLVFVSFTDNDFTQHLNESKGVVFDLFEPFITRLEKHLAQHTAHLIGQAHGMTESSGYMDRMDAINFAMKYDDGVKMEGYDQADLVLVGVSRAGKTPTSLYMSLHYGLLVANYPIADDDFEKGVLPEALLRNKKKLFGLNISSLQLHKIRTKRRANSKYAELRQCQREVQQAQMMFKKYRLVQADSTEMSIEELASLIVHRMDLHVSYL